MIDKFRSTWVRSMNNKFRSCLHGVRSMNSKFRSKLTFSRATLVARLTYASPSWWCCASVEESLRMQAVLNRAHRWGLSGTAHYCLTDICHNLNKTLYVKVLKNSYHVLHKFLPPPVTHSHSLRNCPHNRVVPKRSVYTKFNFLSRMMFPYMIVWDSQTIWSHYFGSHKCSNFVRLSLIIVK